MNVTFVGHDAHRTGAPILLREVVRSFASRPDVRASVVLLRGGPLRGEYEAIAPTRVAGRRFPRVRDVDVAYLNTVETARVARELHRRGARVLVHVHELGHWMEGLPAGDLAAIAECADVVVVVSQAVADDVVAVAGVDPARIRIVPGGVSAPPPTDEAAIAALRAAAGIPPGALVVGGVGTLDWRKGPDVFVQVARAVGPDVRFVWLGGNRSTPFARQVAYEARRSGVEVHFEPHTGDPWPWYRLFDVFALTSRMDPFPLAMLEAGACGAPVVCFERAGGAPEFVRDDAGVVVPFLDVAAMAAAIADLAADPDRRRRLGAAAAARVAEHHTIERMLASIHAVVDELAAR